MAEHRVTVTRTPAYDVGYADIEFEIFGDEEKLGKLHLSRGGVDWWPRDAKKNKVEMTWEQFRDRLERAD
jgi:hypothetical protein